MSQDLIELAESMVICWGLGLLVIVTRVSKFFSNSGWWGAFECMEENLRIRVDGALWSSETLVNSFGTWSSIKSLSVHYEATAVSLHYFRLYGGFKILIGIFGSIRLLRRQTIIYNLDFK